MVFNNWIKNWKNAIAENFFLRSLVILLAIGIILSSSLFKVHERIVVIPPTLTESVWIERNKASKSYLEQMAVFFATFAGNLAPANAEYNVKEMMKYIHPKRQADVKADLAAQAVYIKKNNVYQSFYPAGIHIDESNQSASIEGDVVRGIGSTRISSEKMVFKMKFVIDNYKLYLDDFYADYPDRQKTKMKEKGVLTDAETIREQDANPRKWKEK